MLQALLAALAALMLAAQFVHAPHSLNAPTSSASPAPVVTAIVTPPPPGDGSGGPPQK